MNTAPQFPAPEALTLDKDRRDELANMAFHVYDAGVRSRDIWNSNHLKYDQMLRGQVNDFNPREGPYPNSANFHVQAPFWLISAINTRLMQFVWNQQPLVAGEWQEPTDKEVAHKAARRVEWNLQDSRMAARDKWSRLSKIRLTHGVSVGFVTYAHTKYRFRIYGPEQALQVMRKKNGDIVFEDDGVTPVMEEPERAIDIEERTKYRGPVLQVKEWDDVVVPVGAGNLQPNDEDNPGGATEVTIRSWEPLSLMLRKERDGAYADMLTDETEEEWLDARPSQDLSGGANNTDRERQQDASEGMDRSYDISYREHRDKDDPRYEILTHFGPIEIEDEDGNMEMEEAVIFTCVEPRRTLGVFRLSDILWSGRRPLIDLHYELVSTRFYSMGICEIIWHLSDELDTIHNMRIDVGFATNMPFFLYRATSTFNPDEITLRPFKGIAVANTSDIVFPNLQGKDTFYYNEEQMLLSYIERVFGITDLFLGVSPTRGAAARTATGFLGSQQEGLARLSEIAAQDAISFSMFCKLVYELEMQYGPEERNFRLHGEVNEELTRDDLWFRGTYDFRLGANVGMFSQSAQVQNAQHIMAIAERSPLTNADPGRRWEVEAQMYRALNKTQAEIEAIIGRKESVSAGEAKPQALENSEMASFKYGVGVPAPVHPDDNDMESLQEIIEFLQSPDYLALGSPNRLAFDRHLQAHGMAMQQKREAPPPGDEAGQQQQGPPGQGADTQTRALAQIDMAPTQKPEGSLIEQAAQNGAAPAEFMAS